MRTCDPKRRLVPWCRGLATCLAVCLLGLTTPAARAAQPGLRYAGEPVHPACVHALAMQQPDSTPVTTAVSLAGCAASDRSHSPVRYENDFAVFEDDALLGGGTFGYRELTQLENGIIGLVIRRVSPEGEEAVSLAAVELVTRPMIRNSQIMQVQMVELIGEIWIPGMQVWSFQSIGNRVHFEAGTGDAKVERSVDFTRLGKLRK